MCSLYLVLNFLPVCPTYVFGHPLHFSWYILLLVNMLSCFFILEVILYGVFCFICYFYVSVAKELSNCSGLFAYICLCWPSFLLCCARCRVFILFSSDVYTFVVGNCCSVILFLYVVVLCACCWLKWNTHSLCLLSTELLNSCVQ
jgi:hypothetical protein